MKPSAPLKRRHRARSPCPSDTPNRNRSHPCTSSDEHVFGTSAVSEFTRIGSVAATLCFALGGESGIGADHRGDEFVKRERLRGRRKSGKNDHRLAAGHRQADRLARLQRNAVRKPRPGRAAHAGSGTKDRPRPWTCRPENTTTIRLQRLGQRLRQARFSSSATTTQMNGNAAPAPRPRPRR